MGYDVHITRAEHWASNTAAQITAREWLGLVAADPELELDATSGKHFVEWRSEASGADGTWFDWARGNVYTKWPNEAALGKMLEIALKLGAKVQGDDGELYLSVQDWARYFKGE